MAESRCLLRPFVPVVSDAGVGDAGVAEVLYGLTVVDAGA